VSDVLLATKIHKPLLQSNLVSRPCLVQRLNDGIAQGRRLTLVSAPAGYGKSTLLSEWASKVGVPVAWLSLEKEENDPARFWNYFISALADIPQLRQLGACERMFQALQSPQQPHMRVLLADLVNELSSLKQSMVLVLDEFHTITENQIQQDLVFLIEHLPLSHDTLHMIIASRMDPPWPLARWRARGQLVEIRSADLRFKPEEANDFLNNMMKLGLPLEDVHALENLTEGWIAGLQMAALSLEGREDIKDFIRAFTGSNRYIFDYLVEEVLKRQEQDLQEFLLKTSILDRLSAPLCDAILGRTDSQAILERLEKTNLFLSPLDGERTWYRYHPLFANLLQSSLKQSRAGMVPELHQKACAWFEEHNFLSEALIHALAAGDPDHLTKLVERYAFSIMGVFEASSLLNWLNSLPDQIKNPNPWLNIARAWLLAYLGRDDQVEQAILEAEKSAEKGGHRLWGYIAAMRTIAVELVSGQMQEGIKQAAKALELLPQDEYRPRAFVLYHLANILSWQGETDSALKALAEASSLSLRVNDFEMAMTARFETANILCSLGKLKESLRTFERTRQLSESKNTIWKLKSLPEGFSYLQEAQIHLEWNDLVMALRLASEGIQICTLWGYLDYIYNGWYIFANVLYQTGDMDGALAAIDDAKQNYPKIGRGDRIMALEALINQSRGNSVSADEWLSSCGMSSGDNLDFGHRITYYLIALILEKQGRLDQARRIIERLKVLAEKNGLITLLLNTLTLEAVIAQKQGDDETAINLLQRALQLAEPEGYVRVFLVKGTGMEQLLRKVVTRGISCQYAMTLLEKYDEQRDRISVEKTSPQPTSERKKSQPLLEPLSDRELEVLCLLDTSLDVADIAAELCISVSTVRTHIKNIYSKLNVSRRSQAVERAHDLKLT